MAVEKTNSSSSLAEVIDRILDKGIVIGHQPPTLSALCTVVNYGMYVRVLHFSISIVMNFLCVCLRLAPFAIACVATSPHLP